ncbi:MAG: ABC transporter substrate-binding protein [Dehalococcoidia bacterium]
MNEQNYWQRRRFTRRKLLSGSAVTAGAVMSAALVGCGDDDDDSSGGEPVGIPTAQPTATPGVTRNQGGTLKFAFTIPTRVSPRGATGGTHQEYLSLLGDSYVYINSKGEFDSKLSLWESREQPDSQTIVAKIRPNVKFHDGSVFDATAVKRHLDFMTVAENVPNFGFFSWFANYQGIEVIDPLTVRVKSKTADASFMGIFGLAPGVPFSMDQVEKLGDDEMRQPIMTGPWKLASYKEEASMLLEKNPDYWGERTFDTIDWQHIADSKVRAATLESGDLDAAWWISSDESTLRLSKDSTFKNFPLSVAPESLELNHARPGLVDLRVRQAIASALDKQKVVDVVSRGQGRPTKTGLLPPYTWGSLEYEKYPFDLKAAKQYLDASGVETPVKLVYGYSGTAAQAQSQLTTIQIYQEDLKQIGIEVELKNVPVAATVANSEWQKGELDMVVGSPGVRPDPSIQYNIYLSTQASLAPGARYSTDPIHKEIDAKIQKSLETFDRNEREQIFHDLHRTMIDNVVCRVPTIDRVRWFFHRDTVVAADEVVNAPGGASFRLRNVWRA